MSIISELCSIDELIKITGENVEYLSRVMNEEEFKALIDSISLLGKCEGRIEGLLDAGKIVGIAPNGVVEFEKCFSDLNEIIAAIKTVLFRFDIY